MGETGLQKLQNDKYFFRENPLKIAHGLNFAPKIIPDINYDSLRTMIKKGVQGIPTIPRQLSPCDACILGKNNKQPLMILCFKLLES